MTSWRAWVVEAVVTWNGGEMRHPLSLWSYRENSTWTAA